MATCPHGFPLDQCLICRTLGTTSTTTTAPRRPSGSLIESAPPVLASTSPGQALPSQGRSSAPERKRRGGGTTVLAGLGAMVVAGALVWIFAGLFVLAFHIFEYASIALISGWLGYKMGHAVGRREHRQHREDVR